MSALYSLRTDPGGYRITKFVDGEPEGSYLTSHTECECPAGHRHTCRHRQMLPSMLAHGICDTHWFFAFDTGGQIVDFNGTSKHLLDQLAGSADLTQEETSEDTSSLDAMFNELARIPGITVMGLDDMGVVHNAIADAISEPEAKLAVPAGQHCQAIDQHCEPASVGSKSWRRL